MYKETIYDTFFIAGNKFTVEDYSETKMAVYHEEMFVAEVTDIKEAYAKAVEYVKRLTY